MIDNLENIYRALKEQMTAHVKRIVIITHANPDGDALGSALGLNRILQKAGFESNIIFPTDFPLLVPQMHQNAKWITYDHHESEAINLLNETDLIFLLDFNDLKRIGKLKEKVEKSEKSIVLIDHHPDPKINTPFLFSEIRVSSTAELVYSFIKSMDWTIHLDGWGATCLLTGIIADTASFSHNASRHEVFQAVSELISFGADLRNIQESLFNTNSVDRLKLLGHALSEKMVVMPEFHTAYISLSRNELKRFNFKIGDTEGFVNYPLSIKGIIFSAFFMENEEKIKISFRSKGGFAANAFSSNHFNGGGHFNAAGGESYQSLFDAVEKFKSLLPLYAANLETESSIIY